MSREAASCLPVDHSAAVVLCTARLELHPLADAHAGIYCRLYGDPVVMRLIGAPLTQEAALQAFGRALAQTAESPPRAHYWVCHHLEQVRDQGLLALVYDHGDRGSAEIGMLLPPSEQRHGFASEALAAVAAHAFTRLEVCRLWTRHRPEHAAAGALMRRLGFRSGDSTGDESRWSLRHDDLQVDGVRGPAFALDRECG